MIYKPRTLLIILSVLVLFVIFFTYDKTINDADFETYYSEE